MRVSADIPLRNPNTDFDSFESIDNVIPSECEPVSQNMAYIAAEFDSDKFQGSTLQFTFGKEDGTLNDNPRYRNGLLCYSTSYAFFLRVYNDLVCYTPPVDLLCDVHMPWGAFSVILAIWDHTVMSVFKSRSYIFIFPRVLILEDL